MSCDNMPYRYDEDQKYPISMLREDLPYDSREEPLFSIGDMVGWSKRIKDKNESDAANGFDVNPWKLRKKYAIVREAFWILIDWSYSIDNQSPRDVDADVWEVPYYVPEYTLYWNDGDTSRTVQSCLELISEASDVAK